jgi:hypothetical protein
MLRRRKPQASPPVQPNSYLGTGEGGAVLRTIRSLRGQHGIEKLVERVLEAYDRQADATVLLTCPETSELENARLGEAQHSPRFRAAAADSVHPAADGTLANRPPASAWGETGSIRIANPRAGDRRKHAEIGMAARRAPASRARGQDLCEQLGATPAQSATWAWSTDQPFSHDAGEHRAGHCILIRPQRIVVRVTRGHSASITPQWQRWEQVVRPVATEWRHGAATRSSREYL